MATERKNTSPSAEPRRATARTETPGDTTALDAAQAERDQKLLDQVAESDLEAAPADQQGPTGGSFHNPATVGSGTILPGGTYGAPLPDPNVRKLAEAKDAAEKRDAAK